MSLDRLSSPERGFNARLVHRVLVVAAIVGITLLGNLRSHASEIGRSHAPEQHGPLVAGPPRIDVSLPAVASGAMQDDDEAGTADDELRLVPAIYAWDPDVRFVYFRHVSKWM